MFVIIFGRAKDIFQTLFYVVYIFVDTTNFQITDNGFDNLLRIWIE